MERRPGVVCAHWLLLSHRAGTGCRRVQSSCVAMDPRGNYFVVAAACVAGSKTEIAASQGNRCDMSAVVLGQPSATTCGAIDRPFGAQATPALQLSFWGPGLARAVV